MPLPCRCDRSTSAFCSAWSNGVTTSSCCVCFFCMASEPRCPSRIRRDSASAIWAFSGPDNGDAGLLQDAALLGSTREFAALTALAVCLLCLVLVVRGGERINAFDDGDDAFSGEPAPCGFEYRPYPLSDGKCIEGGMSLWRPPCTEPRAAARGGADFVTQEARTLDSKRGSFICSIL